MSIMIRENGVIVPRPEQFGFCEGVEAAHQALSRVRDAAVYAGFSTVYGYHDIVHNADVTRFHQDRGVVFVNSPSEVPPESIVVGSAHGSSPEVVAEFGQAGSLFFDAACPLVLHTHKAIQNARQRGETVVYLLSGKPGAVTKIHDEVAGSVGHMDFYIDELGNLVEDPVDRHYVELSEDPSEIAEAITQDGSTSFRLVGQTTLLATASLEFKDTLKSAILNRNPDATVERADRRDVCFAVEDRQRGVAVLLGAKPDNLVVVTDPNSKNGMGYVNLASQIAQREGLQTEVHAVANAASIDTDISGTVAITASASTPDRITREVVERLGGLSDQVPAERPSFRLRGCREDEIKARIGEWLLASQRG